MTDAVPPHDDPLALPAPWRDPGLPESDPHEPLPFLGATPAVHRGLLVHAPATAGLVLVLRQDEPALWQRLFDATWAVDDPHAAAQRARFELLADWLQASVLGRADGVPEEHAWRDRVVEFAELAMPALPLLFTVDILEAEFGFPADLAAAGTLRKLTTHLKTATQPAPLLAPAALAVLIGDRSPADCADQLALPGADERQFLRRLQERYDGWEAPTWHDIIRVTAAAWRAPAPWRRMLLHAQLDRLRPLLPTEQPLDAADTEQALDEARLLADTAARAAGELEQQVTQLQSDLETSRATAAELPGVRLALEEARLKAQRMNDRRELLERRVTALEDDVEGLRQALAAAEQEAAAWRLRVEGPPADDAAEEAAPEAVPTPPEVPADLLAGYRVAMFTGQERAAVRAQMLAVLQSVGAGSDAQVHLIRGGGRGGATYGAGDLVLVDCRFVSHKETEALETRIGPEALLLNLHRGIGGLKAELGARLERRPDGTLARRR